MNANTKRNLLRTMTVHSFRYRLPALACVAVAAGMQLTPALAQQQGTAVIGATGGLVIPSAAVLTEGDFALQANTYVEPRLQRLAPRDLNNRVNYLMGVGLFKGLEVYGRMAEFRYKGLPKRNFYARDISANFKYQLPQVFRGQPKVALGITDIKGGSNYFESYYGVISDRIGSNLDWSLGYARGAGKKTFDGVFGGAELHLPNSGFSLLAEYDGSYRHAGARYVSRPIRRLGGVQLSGQLQRSFGATDRSNRAADKWTLGLAVNIPVGSNARKKRYYEPQAHIRPLSLGTDRKALSHLTQQDRIDQLTQALRKAGLERVRVGVVGATLVIQYENHRFAHNEADALGVVLGLGAELIPEGLSEITAIVLKNGAMQYYSSVDADDFSDFLRRGSTTALLESFDSSTRPSFTLDEVDWQSGEATPHTRARIVIKPELNYFVATEVGNFDYSLGANIGVHVPLWKGGQFLGEYVAHLDSTEHFDPGTTPFNVGVFASRRVKTGLKSAVLQQSLWLSPRLLVSGGAGKYHYDYLGGQGSLYLLTRGNRDMLKMQYARYTRTLEGDRYYRTRWKTSYRWAILPQTWVEAGVERYQDGSQGPSLSVTRWAGDVGIIAHYKKGGHKQFVGMSFAVPLTPRRGMAGGSFFSISGDSSYTNGIRTRIADSHSGGRNDVGFNAGRSMELLYDVEKIQLNAGRFSQSYQLEQLYRMREAFFLYARAYLP